MNYELPILGSINPGNDVQTIIQGYEAGLVTVNGDDKGFLRNALLLLNDEPYRKKLGRNGKKLLKNVFSVEKVGEQLVNSVDM